MLSSWVVPLAWIVRNKPRRMALNRVQSFLVRFEVWVRYGRCVLEGWADNREVGALPELLGYAAQISLEEG